MHPEWGNFFLAETGAAAALPGLLFVAVSINISEVLAFPSLPGRAGQTLAMLVGALVMASVTLIPDQSTTVVGVELLVLGGFTWALVVVIDLRSRQYPEYREASVFWLRILLTQIATLPAVVAGVVVVAGLPLPPMSGERAVYDALVEQHDLREVGLRVESVYREGMIIGITRADQWDLDEVAESLVVDVDRVRAVPTFVTSPRAHGQPLWHILERNLLTRPPHLQIWISPFPAEVLDLSFTSADGREALGTIHLRTLGFYPESWRAGGGS